MRVRLTLLLLLWFSVVPAHAEEPGQQPAVSPEQDAVLRKKFLDKVSADITTREEAVVRRYIELARLFPDKQQVYRETQSKLDSLKKTMEMKRKSGPSALNELISLRHQANMLEKVQRYGELMLTIHTKEQSLLIRQYRLLTQLEELDADLQNKRVTRAEYLRLRQDLEDAIVRMKQSWEAEWIAVQASLNLSETLSDTLRGIESTISDDLSAISATLSETSMRR